MKNLENDFENILMKNYLENRWFLEGEPDKD